MKYMINNNIIYVGDNEIGDYLLKWYPEHKVILVKDGKFDEIYNEMISNLMETMESEIDYEDRKIKVLSCSDMIMCSVIQNLTKKDLRRIFPQSHIFLYTHPDYQKLKMRIVENVVKYGVSNLEKIIKRNIAASL